MSVDKGRVNTKLMGIDTKDFGETAYFKTNLLDKHWYHYLNDLAKDENGVIVSSNFKEKYGYKLETSYPIKTTMGLEEVLLPGL